MSKKNKSKKRLIRQRRFVELQKLQEKAVELENRIKKQELENFKQFNIRNLRVFKSTCNFLVPFVISSGITVGLFAVCCGGLPFYTDDVVKYKTYSLDYQTNGYITMDEFYKTARWIDEQIPESELTIYTPWQYENNQYIRYKREYDVSSNSVDLFEAVLKEDYDYIKDNMKEYKEEIQVASSIYETDENDYFFEASLHMLDKKDSLRYDESTLKNIIITIVELILGLGVGAFVAWVRNFDYIWEIEDANSEYHYRIKAVRPWKTELDETRNKILSLSKKLGRRNQ